MLWGREASSHGNWCSLCFLALSPITGWVLYSRLRSSAFSTYGWADCHAIGRVFPWIPWTPTPPHPPPPQNLTSFIFQYIVWKVSKNALEEYSKKEEVFVLRDTLFFPTGLLFCPLPLPSLPPQKAVKQRETARNQRLQGSRSFSLHLWSHFLKFKS